MEIGPIWHPGPLSRYLILALLLWPFVSIPLVRRGRAAAAMLFALALGAFEMWHMLVVTMEGLSISGSGRAAAAAGVAEGAMSLFLAAIAAAIVSLMALRRGIAFDAMTRSLAIVVVAEIAGALAFGARLPSPRWPALPSFAWPAFWLSFAVLLASFALLFRGITAEARLRPLFITLAACAILGIAVWRYIAHFHFIAMHG